MIIYSPVAIHFLRDYWENSLFEFCMPYEIGLPSTKNVVTDWKRVYEKKIVFDLENVFKDNGFIVRSNFELKNLDKKKYPQYLGDYDLFAVNLQAKEIWIIECKVIEKVETFYEMYRQQNRFFTIAVNTPTFHAIKDNSINDSNINENITFLYIIYPLLISLATGIRSVKTLPIIFPHTGHSTSSRSRLPSHIDLSSYSEMEPHLSQVTL